MRRFWEDRGEKRKLEEALTEHKQNYDEKQARLTKIQQELDCEQSIINEKETFGRLRASMMRYLRTKYGQELTNRIQWRINKRQNKNKSLRN